LRHGHAVRHQGVRGRDPRRHHVGVGRDARRPRLWAAGGACHCLLRLDLHADRGVLGRDRRADADAERAARPRRRQQGMTMRFATPLTILGLTCAGIAFAFLAGSYAHFILALVALTTVVGVGLNILVGLAGQVSLGHIGFYAIGAYATSILTLKGLNFWLALPLSGALAGIIGAALALPALRVTGPYLAMITIAFAFIVQHGTIEWRELTGGQNGLMGIMPPSLGPLAFAEREMAILSTLLAGLALYLFHRLAASAWGKAMLAVRDSETAARSIGLNPVTMKTVAFALSALFTGLAGAIFAPLMMFVAPDSFPFSQSILFLLAVIVGGAGWVVGPVVGAVVTVVLPELLAWLAEYRLLLFGVLLLVVLWLAPSGVIGTLARHL